MYDIFFSTPSFTSSRTSLSLSLARAVFKVIFFGLFECSCILNMEKNDLIPKSSSFISFYISETFYRDGIVFSMACTMFQTTIQRMKGEKTRGDEQKKVEN